MEKTMDLKEQFKYLCDTPSDINEHLPTLYEYAQECDHITEMGVREVVSTYALMMGKPKTLICIDIEHPKECGGPECNARYDFAFEQDTDYTFIEGDTLKIEIDETDMLFIDTLHNYKQLREELVLHGNKARKYLIFHDTTTYGWADELPELSDSPTRGLVPAIKSFQSSNPHWVEEKVFTNNNGLTILKRKQ